MKLLKILTAFVILSSTTMASTPVVVVTKAGYFVLEQDQEGNLTSKKATVILLDEPPTVDPGDPDKPKPDELDSVGTAVKNEAVKADDPKTAKALSVLTENLVKLIDNGTLNAGNAGKALDVGWEATIKEVDGKITDWSATYAVVSAEAVAAAQSGNLSTSKQWASFLTSVSKGLDAATEGALLDNINEIIELVMLVIELIRQLFG